MPQRDSVFQQSPLIVTAITLMRQLLGEQRRMCGEFSSDHCERVGRRLEPVVSLLGQPLATETICGGVLHDVIEDGVDWNDATARNDLRQRIIGEFGEETLRIIDAVTIDQRLAPEDQFAIIIARARDEFQVPECLVKLADLVDNWPTRHVYAMTYLSLWERTACKLMEKVIPERLHLLGWRGSIPFNLLDLSPR